MAQQAEKHLSAVLKIQPGHIPAMIYLALAKHIIGQSADEVIGLLKLAGKSRTAGSPYAWFRLALILEKEQPDQALLFYENSGDFPNSLVNAGRLLAKEGKYYPAIEKYKRAIILNPRMYEAYNEIAWRTFKAFEKNEIELTPGDLIYARNAAEKALEFSSNRDKPHAYHILGLMLFTTRKFIEAKDNLQQAISEKINSKNKPPTQYYYYYAKALIELEDKTGALEQIDKILNSSKTSDEYYQKFIHLKNCLEKKLIILICH